jgi:hypothetical protein
MTEQDNALALLQREDPDQIIEPVAYDFGFSRRSFMQVLGAGLLISAAGSPDRRPRTWTPGCTSAPTASSP